MVWYELHLLCHVRLSMKVTSRIRAYRDHARVRHEFQRALEGAATPLHREELLAIARHSSRVTISMR